MQATGFSGRSDRARREGRRWTQTRRLLAGLLCLLTAAASAEVPYEVSFEGVPDELAGAVEAASRLVELRDRPPATVAALRRRAEDDLARLKPVVNGAGYWNAALSVEIDSAATPATVRVEVEPGPVYTLETVTLQDQAGGTPPVLDRYHPASLGLALGEPARSDPVLAAERRIVETLARNGYPWATVADRKVVIDHGTQAMQLTYIVAPGAPATFGAATIEGLDRVERDWLQRRIEWKPGEPYDSRAVEATRKTLAESGLFAQIAIAPAPTPAPDGSAPMTITVSERAPRSIGAGIQYNSSEGFGARAFWEHRNLLGDAEELRASIDLAQQRLGANLDFRRPDLLARGADFIAQAELAQEEPDAYEVRRLRLFGGIEQRFGPSVTAGYGLAFEQLFFNETGPDREFTLLGAPLFVRRDTTDDLLDPTIGTRLSLSMTPWTSVAGADVTFLSARATASAYHTLDTENRFIVAGFAALGTIIGPDLDRIPPDKRLYAGGGGSVRGYGYQRIGPLDAGGDPIGGKGSLEAGLELRIKITETIGVAPFLEAGIVNEGMLPNDRVFVGTGLGVRYFTPIGPVRLDFGVPLDKRRSDDAFQVYISLGQAF
jgi:translocation and assembly module TamA